MLKGLQITKQYGVTYAYFVGLPLSSYMLRSPALVDVKSSVSVQMASFLRQTGVEQCAAAWLLSATVCLQRKPLPFAAAGVAHGVHDAIGLQSDYEGHEVEWKKVMNHIVHLCPHAILYAYSAPLSLSYFTLYRSLPCGLIPQIGFCKLSSTMCLPACVSVLEREENSVPYT